LNQRPEDDRGVPDFSGNRLQSPALPG